MNFPVIGIAPRNNSLGGNLWAGKKSFDWIAETGAVPVMLDIRFGDYPVRCCELLDGIVFPGGGDILPEYYGEEGTDDCEGIDRLRDEFELLLFRCARRVGIPALGICRGAQLMAVGLGGRLCRRTLWHDKGIIHRIFSVSEYSILSGAIPSGGCEVNSYHRQSVLSLPPEAHITAVAQDGTIEAFEMSSGAFCAGIQWHPELIPENNLSEKLIRVFSGAVFDHAGKRIRPGI